jgi:MFS transporter, PAT family, beta-lactamase induction signal transducer AmpG
MAGLVTAPGTVACTIPPPCDPSSGFDIFTNSYNLAGITAKLPILLNQTMVSILRSILSARMLAVLVLGFSSGLPLLLIGATLKAWLHDAGIDLTTIGLFAFVGLPYTLEFIWSPVMDRYVPPFLDRRRGWILIWQSCLLAGIAAMGWMHPATHSWLLAGLCVLIAFFSASQDIVINAYTREILSNEELGFGFSLGIAGYRVGMLVASAGALPLADAVGWRFTYIIMAGGMIIGIIAALLAPAVKIISPPLTLRDAVINPFLQFFSRNGAWIILLFILLYKVGDQMASDIVNPFYLDLGFSKTQIGVVAKIFGFSAMIAGGLLGGLLLFKLGIYRSLWIFGVLQGVSTLSFAFLAQIGLSIPLLAGVVSLENLASGMAGASYAAYMASLCDRRYTATQYALFTSLIGVTRVVFVSTSGFLAKHLGWEYFFIFCALLAIPGLALLLRLRPIIYAEATA